MKKCLLIALTSLLCFNYAMAQKHEAGIQLGYDWALTYQYNLSDKYSLDFGLVFPGKAIYPSPTNNSNTLPWNLGGFGVQARAFFLWNFELGVDGLSLYAGPGIYQGFSSITREDVWGTKNRELLYMGSINGKVGVKYKLASTPLAFTFDWAPGIAFSDEDIYGRFENKVALAWWTFGAGIRYTF